MIKNDNSEKNDEEKELGCLDDTSPDNMEDDACDKNNYKNEKKDKKRLNT